MKWCTGSQADLYHVMIYMFLSPTDDLGENQLFPGQKTLQVIFIYIPIYLSIIVFSWIELRHFVVLLTACTATSGSCVRALDVDTKTLSFEEAAQ